MIPDLVDGVLPEGLHDATMEAIASRFGGFQRTNQRIRLTERLRSYIEEARTAGIATAVIIDGSYVSQRDEPNDIDLILVLRLGHDATAELRPFRYNILSKRMVRKTYGFDVVAVINQGREYHKAIEYFSRVRPEDEHPYTNRPRKGLLRILL